MVKFSFVPLLMTAFYLQINEEYGVHAGDPSPSTLIVGGRDVPSAKAWPWQAGIVVPREGFICGGTLIDLTTVLTAAHCVDRSRNGTIMVVLGEFDRRVVEGYEQYIPVRDISKHPSYRNDFLSGYDIALLHLSTGARVTSRVIPIPAIARRKQKFTKPSTDCYITGWGVSTLDNSPSIPLTKNDTEPDQEKKECFKNEVPKIVGSYGGLAGKLQEASISVITNNQCNSKQYWNGMVKSTNICAFHKDKAACEGDSGGPLVCWNKRSYVLVGTTSWGSVSCTDYPTVFTKVASFRRWIKKSKEEIRLSMGDIKISNLTSEVEV